MPSIVTVDIDIGDTIFPDLFYSASVLLDAQETCRNCKAIDRIRKGSLIECSTETYYSEIRDAVIRFALDCVDSNDVARMRIALAEVNRLDKEHGYGLSAESPDELT